jgi:hypothetical protein
MQYWTNKETAESILDIVLNIDRIGEEKYQGNVLNVNYTNYKPKKLKEQQIFDTIQEVKKEVVKVKDDYRKNYLLDKLVADEYFLRYLSGDDIEYPVLLEKIEQLPCEEIEEKKYLSKKESVDKLTSELGYKGTLKEKIENWLEDGYLNKDEVVEYAKKYVDKFKEKTRSKVMNLTENEGIESVNPIQGVFWSGFSKYTGNHKGTLTFNIDKKWNKYIFLHVLSHEAYPGHQAFYSRWDYLLKKDEFPFEASYYTLNQPNNSIFEGVPENAIDFIGLMDENDIFDEKEQKNIILAKRYNEFFRIAQTNASYYYNTGKMNKEEVINYMNDKAFINELDAENTYRFFTSKLNGICYPSYYYGKNIIEDQFSKAKNINKDKYFKEIYDNPHTNNTLKNKFSELF